MAIDPGVGSAGAGEPVTHLGARLRRAREASGLSLREVARQLGVSASFVSQLENGKSQPSVATLYSMAQLLDVSIDRLFEGSRAADGAGRPSAPNAPGGRTVGPAPAKTARGRADDAMTAPITRSQFGSPGDAWPGEKLERLSVSLPGSRPRLIMDSGVIWEQLAGNTGHNLDFIEMIYPAGSSSTNDDRMLRHDGYEYGYLVDGELQVTYGFDRFMLKAGECLGMDSSVPHLFKNLGSTTARGIWFVLHRHA